MGFLLFSCHRKPGFNVIRVAWFAPDQDGYARGFIGHRPGKDKGFRQVALHVIGKETDLVRDQIPFSPNLEDPPDFTVLVFGQALPIQVVLLKFDLQCLPADSEHWIVIVEHGI